MPSGQRGALATIRVSVESGLAGSQLVGFAKIDKALISCSDSERSLVIIDCLVRALSVHVYRCVTFSMAVDLLWSSWHILTLANRMPSNVIEDKVSTISRVFLSNA